MTAQARPEQIFSRFATALRQYCEEAASLADDLRDAVCAANEAATCECCDPHEVIYIQFSDTGENIRKWSRTPFENCRKCRVELRDALKTADSCADPENMHTQEQSA